MSSECLQVCWESHTKELIETEVEKPVQSVLQNSKQVCFLIN